MDGRSFCTQDALQTPETDVETPLVVPRGRPDGSLRPEKTVSQEILPVRIRLRKCQDPDTGHRLTRRSQLLQADHGFQATEGIGGIGNPRRVREDGQKPPCHIVRSGEKIQFLIREVRKFHSGKEYRRTNPAGSAVSDPEERDDMKGSSYEQVYMRLMTTDDAASIVQRIEAAYYTAAIDGWEFVPDSDRGTSVARPKFRVKVSGPNGSPVRIPSDPGCVKIPAAALVSFDELDDLASKNFSLGPTYFCRLSTVLHGCSTERGRKHVHSFSSWALDRLDESFKSERLVAESRLDKLSLEISKTPGFAWEQKQALENFARKDLEKAVRRYPGLGKSFFETALSELGGSKAA